MALFGSLNALPLEKLLQLLAHKEGALETWNVKDIPATTIYLKPGYIRSIDQHGKPLEALAAKATLQALLQAREGSFEFLPGAKPKHKVRLNWCGPLFFPFGLHGWWIFSAGRDLWSSRWALATGASPRSLPRPIRNGSSWGLRSRRPASKGLTGACVGKE